MVFLSGNMKNRVRIKQNNSLFEGNKRLGWKQGGTVFCTSPSSFSVALSTHWNPVCYLFKRRVLGQYLADQYLVEN